MQTTPLDTATPRGLEGRVLFVMDKSLAQLHVELLRDENVQIEDVQSGAAAVALRRLRPHLVIADVELKSVNAEEIARMLTQTPHGTPLILVGAPEATVLRRSAALSFGAFDYFCLKNERELLLRRSVQLIALKQMIDELNTEADRDHLTGLPNRRRFRTAFSGELERFKRYQTPCALLLIDIDFLKKINDTHGHAAGDAAIRHVAASLQSQSRNNDTAARLGGEEFALLLAGADESSATVVAERLRQAVEIEPLEGIGAVTISIGIAACPAHAMTERTLYTASDKALYRAKETGRNRVAVAE
ncbi:MAG: hypothetical protein NVSMB56_08010 [Pyrinomonadaceae bacterium]